MRSENWFLVLISHFSPLTYLIMSQENFEQFRNIVLEDLSLQKQLRAFTREDRFIVRVVKLGAERGFQFTYEDVKEAMRASRRAWIERWI